MKIGTLDGVGSIGSVPISRVGGSDSNARSNDCSFSIDGSDANNSFNNLSNIAGSKSVSRYSKKQRLDKIENMLNL